MGELPLLQVGCIVGIGSGKLTVATCNMNTEIEFSEANVLVCALKSIFQQCLCNAVKLQEQFQIQDIV